MKRLKLFVSVLVLFLLMMVFTRSLAIVQADKQPEAPPNYDCTQVSQIPPLECEALVALYNATDGPNWNDQTNWLVTNTPCSWYGISCTSGVVKIINLENNNLTGAIPPEIGNLVNLTYLILGSNQLTVIPPEIGNLVNLLYLGLNYNQLMTVPPEIGNLVNLLYLGLNYNQLMTVPPEIGNLVNLTGLDLDGNQLTAVPPEIGNFVNLLNLSLDNNQLAAVPPEIWSMVNLTDIWLGNNQLTTVPPEIGNLVNLTQLGLNGNQLTAVPPEIDHLINLTELHLYENQLAAIPPEIGYLGNLSYLYLWSNQLTAVPPEIGNLVNLLYLGLGDNQLMTVPPEIGNLVNLTGLDLNGNQLTAVPPEIWNLINLADLNLANNQLTTVPPEIGSLVNLRSLGLPNNQLTTVPPEIGSLVKLSELNLADNQLTTVPSEIGNLVKLNKLNLAGNQLATVPPEIGSLVNLRSLDFSNNQLTAVPPEIGNLGNLFSLYLDRNPLTGSLPQSLTSLQQLIFFTFYDTGWCIPDDVGLKNWLAGVSEVHGTGLRCGQPAGAFSGLVTNAQGEALPNAQVVLYRSAPESSQIIVSSTQANGLGQYAFTDLGQGIDYYVHFQDGNSVWAPEYYENKNTLETADPITATLGFTRTINAQLNIAHPPLITVSFGSGSATSSVNPLDGTVHINIPTGGATDLTLTYAAACAGNETPTAVVLTYNGQQYPMTVSGSNYQATIPAVDITASTAIIITTTCNGKDTAVTVGSITLYDPTGIISDASTQEPVVGAKVTLFQVPGWLPRNGPNDTRPDTCESNTSKPADVPWSQPAPTNEGVPVNTDLTTIAPLIGHQYTNDVGLYGWDVPAGCWYVVVEAEGYDKLVSPVVGVPPAVLDLNLALTPSKQFVYLPMIIRP